MPRLFYPTYVPTDICPRLLSLPRLQVTQHSFTAPDTEPPSITHRNRTGGTWFEWQVRHRYFLQSSLACLLAHISADNLKTPSNVSMIYIGNRLWWFQCRVNL